MRCLKSLSKALLLVSPVAFAIACNSDPRTRGPVVSQRGLGGVTSAMTEQRRQEEAARAQAVPLKAELTETLKTDDHRQSLALIDRIEALQGDPDQTLAASRFGVLLRSGDTDAAYRFAATAEQRPQPNGWLFNQFARAILDTPNVAERDLILARRYARQANNFAEKPAEFAKTLDDAMTAK